MIFYSTHIKGHMEILTSNFFWKVKHDQYNSWAHLFGTSITLLQWLIYLWSSLNFWSTQPLAFQKKSCHENFSKLPKNIRFGVLNLSTFSCVLGVRETTRLERFMSVYTCKRKHAWEIWACAEACACDCILHMAKRELFIHSFWIRDICVAQWKRQILKVLSDQKFSE